MDRPTYNAVWAEYSSRLVVVKVSDISFRIRSISQQVSLTIPWVGFLAAEVLDFNFLLWLQNGNHGQLVFGYFRYLVIAVKCGGLLGRNQEFSR
jgi:hypothetical protein